MVNFVELSGYDEFVKYAESINPNGPPTVMYFSGSKLPSGESWCPDCVEEKYVIDACLSNYVKGHFFFNMGVNIVQLNDYGQFTNFVDKLPDKGSKVGFFFTGKKKDNGRSWCISCQLAEAVVKPFFSELQKDVTFVYVDVGDRDYWKDKACPFRTDSRLKLMVIPTIIVWKGVQRLEGSQCNKRELLQMLFEDEE